MIYKGTKNGNIFNRTHLVRFLPFTLVFELIIGADMSGHVRFWYVPIVLSPKTHVKRFLKINVNKGLMNARRTLLFGFGSFLEIDVVYGHQYRAMSDFFGGKSMSGRWVKRPVTAVKKGKRL